MSALITLFFLVIMIATVAAYWETRRMSREMAAMWAAVARRPRRAQLEELFEEMGAAAPDRAADSHTTPEKGHNGR